MEGGIGSSRNPRPDRRASEREIGGQLALGVVEFVIPGLL